MEQLFLLVNDSTSDSETGLQELIYTMIALELRTSLGTTADGWVSMGNNTMFFHEVIYLGREIYHIQA